MRIRQAMIAAFAAAAFLPVDGQAQDMNGRFSLTLEAGTDLELSGDVHDGGSGTVLALPTSVEARSFGDVYDPGFRAQASLGYGVGRASELFLRGSYYKMGSGTLQVGTVAGLTLNADFADYEEWGAELGYRYFFGEAGLRPYVGVAAGLRFVSELPATFSVPAAGVVLTDVPFYESSTVGVFGADLGLRYGVSDSLSLGIEAGLRYQTGLSDLEGLAGTGLEPINDVGSRWSLPVVASLSFRF